MAKEFSFDSFPYETSHYSILSTTNDSHDESKNLKHEIGGSEKISLIAGK